jgi:hypothetical protein
MRGEGGDLGRAVAELEQALTHDFDYIDAYYFYLGEYYATEEKDYPRAFLAWDQFLRFSDNEELESRVHEWMDAYQSALEEEGGP